MFSIVLALFHHTGFQIKQHIWEQRADFQQVFTLVLSEQCRSRRPFSPLGSIKIVAIVILGSLDVDVNTLESNLKGYRIKFSDVAIIAAMLLAWVRVHTNAKFFSWLHLQQGYVRI